MCIPGCRVVRTWTLGLHFDHAAVHQRQALVERGRALRPRVGGGGGQGLVAGALLRAAVDRCTDLGGGRRGRKRELCQRPSEGRRRPGPSWPVPSCEEGEQPSIVARTREGRGACVGGGGEGGRVQ